MAKTILPVNFQDDVLNASMDGKRRYKLIPNADGSYSLEDVTDYDLIGSNFGANQINATNKAVNDINNGILDTMEEVEANTESGKVAGALALKDVIESLIKFDTENFIEIKIVATGGTNGTYTVPDNTVGMISLYAALPKNSSFYIKVNGYTVKGVQTGDGNLWIHDLIPLVVRSGDVIEYKAPAEFKIGLLSNNQTII